jgi:hypothetical protein
MRGQVDLHPSSLEAEYADALAQRNADISCHPFSMNVSFSSRENYSSHIPYRESCYSFHMYASIDPL